MKNKVVLNRSYGGFTLCQELVDKMDDLGFDWKQLGHDQKPTGYVYCELMDSFSFRSDPILIQSVQELQDIHNNATFGQKRKLEIFKLGIYDIPTTFTIRDYHDGYETLDFNGRDVLFLSDY